MTIDEVETTFVTLGRHEDERFEAMRHAVWLHQRVNNSVYRRYCDALADWEMPYLPVEAFKHEAICCGPAQTVERVFESSGTGRGIPSRHYVRSLSVYDRSSIAHFRAIFGEAPVTLIAHLPHYESKGAASSLLYMVERLIASSGDALSGFFLDDDRRLDEAVDNCADQGTPFILFGAAFGLLDLVERRRVRLPEHACVIETGGMKTFRREITREALHERLASGFGVPPERVWSEYGMCEMLSQCYTRGGTVFYPPPWVRFSVVDPGDPMRPVPEGEIGALALVDLANLHAVSAILTQDGAVRVGDGFEVTGRLQGADLRGCNFLVEQLP